MKRLFYPAVFHKAEEGGYWITFSNFPDIQQNTCVMPGNMLYLKYRKGKPETRPTLNNV